MRYLSTKIRKEQVVALILIMAMLCSFSACRPSPTLEQKEYVSNETIDKDKQSIENNDENDNEDEELESKKEKEDADRETDYDYDRSTLGSDENNDDEADDEDKTTSPEKNDAEEEDNPGTKPVKDPKVLRQIVDANGQVVDIPKNVDKVVALDYVALFVEMLGGSGRLVATSESYRANSFATKIFGASETTAIPALWEKTGNTSSGMSSANFNKLVNLNPDVVFVVNRNNLFSDAQLATLKENYIYVVTLSFTTTDNIMNSVKIMGEVLGDRSSSGGTNAPKIATAYNKWLKKIHDNVRGKGHAYSGEQLYDFNYDRTRQDNHRVDDTLNATGFSTVYISKWNDSVSYTAANEKYNLFSGSGLAVAPLGYATDTPLSYYMAVGGVCNLAAQEDDPLRMKILERYVSPLNVSVLKTTDDSNWNKSTSKSITKTLGSDTFKNVIVATKEIKNKILANADLYDGLWKVYPRITINGVEANFNTNHKEVPQGIPSNIVGDYNVIVNPCGVGEWVMPSPESPLEMMWISTLYYDDYSETDLRKEISNFYSEFYHYKLSSSEIDGILAGK